MANFSKQREAILKVLQSTDTHPVAEWVYQEVSKIIPNISLGTVYRNLASLEKSKQIIKVPRLNDKDRYDATLVPHAHVVCQCCGKIKDLYYESDIREKLDSIAHNNDFENYSLTFTGICEECASKAQNNGGN